MDPGTFPVNAQSCLLSVVEKSYKDYADTLTKNVETLPFTTTLKELQKINLKYAPYVFKNGSGETSDHPIAAVSRILGSKLLSRVKNDQITVLEIGPRMDERTAHHGCLVNGDARDAARYLKYETRVGANIDITHDPRPNTCTVGFADCDVQADVGIMNHVYDLSQEDLAAGMIRHGIKILHYVMYLPDLAYQGKWDFYPERGYGMQDNGETITMYFNSGSLSYTHNKETWMEHFARSAFTEPKSGKHFIVEKRMKVGDAYVLVMAEADMGGVFSSNLLPDDDNNVKIFDVVGNVERLEKEMKEPGFNSERFVKSCPSIVVPARFVNKIIINLFTKSDSGTDRQFTAGYMRSLCECITVGSKVIQAGVNLTANEFDIVFRNLHCIAMANRMQQTTTIGRVFRLLGQKDSFHMRMLAKLQHVAMKIAVMGGAFLAKVLVEALIRKMLKLVAPNVAKFFDLGIFNALRWICFFKSAPKTLNLYDKHYAPENLYSAEVKLVMDMLRVYPLKAVLVEQTLEPHGGTLPVRMRNPYNELGNPAYSKKNCLPQTIACAVYGDAEQYVRVKVELNMPYEGPYAIVWFERAAVYYNKCFLIGSQRFGVGEPFVVTAINNHVQPHTMYKFCEHAIAYTMPNCHEENLDFENNDIADMHAARVFEESKLVLKNQNKILTLMEYMPEEVEVHCAAPGNDLQDLVLKKKITAVTSPLIGLLPNDVNKFEKKLTKLGISPGKPVNLCCGECCKSIEGFCYADIGSDGSDEEIVATLIAVLTNLEGKNFIVKFQRGVLCLLSRVRGTGTLYDLIKELFVIKSPVNVTEFYVTTTDTDYVVDELLEEYGLTGEFYDYDNPAFPRTISLEFEGVDSNIKQNYNFLNNLTAFERAKFWLGKAGPSNFNAVSILQQPLSAQAVFLHEYDDVLVDTDPGAALLNSPPEKDFLIRTERGEDQTCVPHGHAALEDESLCENSGVPSEGSISPTSAVKESDRDSELCSGSESVQRTKCISGANTFGVLEDELDQLCDGEECRAGSCHTLPPSNLNEGRVDEKTENSKAHKDAAGRLRDRVLVEDVQDLQDEQGWSVVGEKKKTVVVPAPDTIEVNGRTYGSKLADKVSLCQKQRESTDRKNCIGCLGMKNFYGEFFVNPDNTLRKVSARPKLLPPAGGTCTFPRKVVLSCLRAYLADLSVNDDVYEKVNNEASQSVKELITRIDTLGEDVPITVYGWQGVPGSGKSTNARSYLDQSTTTVIVPLVSLRSVYAAFGYETHTRTAGIARNKKENVLIDEAWLFNVGELFYYMIHCALNKKQLFMCGHSKQNVFHDEKQLFQWNTTELLQPFSDFFSELNVSYTMPIDICNYLEETHGIEAKTISMVENSVSYNVIHESDKNSDLIVFSRTAENNLNARTVAKIQGLRLKEAAVYLDPNSHALIRNCPHQVVVAVSRHSAKLRILTLTTENGKLIPIWPLPKEHTCLGVGELRPVYELSRKELLSRVHHSEPLEQKEYRAEIQRREKPVVETVVRKLETPLLLNKTTTLTDKGYLDVTGMEFVEVADKITLQRFGEEEARSDVRF